MWRLRCTSCDADDLTTRQPLTACPHCGGQWLEPIYDYAALGADYPQTVRNRRYTMWRYRELLPLSDDGIRPAELLGLQVFIPGAPELTKLEFRGDTIRDVRLKAA